jgi:hypothetical protein
MMERTTHAAINTRVKVNILMGIFTRTNQINPNAAEKTIDNMTDKTSDAASSVGGGGADACFVATFPCFEGGASLGA